MARENSTRKYVHLLITVDTFFQFSAATTKPLRACKQTYNQLKKMHLNLTASDQWEKTFGLLKTNFPQE